MASEIRKLGILSIFEAFLDKQTSNATEKSKQLASNSVLVAKK
jgi:hypothetical protein